MLIPWQQPESTRGGMWCVALCSGLVALYVAGQNFEEILQHLITPQVEREKKDPGEKAIRVLVSTYYFSVPPRT